MHGEAKNEDLRAVQQEQFKPHHPRSEPEERGGHQPGILVGNERIPTFHAEVLPAGTVLPKDETFKPNPEGQMPAASEESVGTANQESITASAVSEEAFGGAGTYREEDREDRERRGNHKEEFPLTKSDLASEEGRHHHQHHHNKR